MGAEEEARLKAVEEARLKAEEEARLKAAEAARLKAEEEALLKAAEEARLKAEEESRLKVEEEARLKAAEEARLKADEFDAYDSFLRKVFDGIDADLDGYITTKELSGNHELMDMFASPMLTVGEGNVQEKAEEYVQVLDRDGDRRITFDEFRNYFKPKLQIVAPHMQK